MTNSRALSGVRKSARAARPMSKQGLRILLYAQLLLVDMLAILIGAIVTSHLLDVPIFAPFGWRVGYALVPIYVALALNNGAYSIFVLRSNLESLRRALSAFAVAMMAMLLIAFFRASDLEGGRVPFLATFGVIALLLVGARMAFSLHVKARSDDKLVDELLIVDHDNYCGPLLRYTINARAEQITPDLRSPEMIARVAHYLYGFDRVIVCCPPERQHPWSLILKGANVRGEIVVDRPLQLDAIGLSSFQDRDTLIVSRGPLNLANRAKKRLLDLVCTIPVLIALLPILAIIAIAIKLDSPGPVIFRQQRVGRGNRMFAIMKFRSMRVEQTDATGARSASRDDDRITRVGRFIRATSIDELPQLFNVLIGDMSLVGPRPHALGSLAGDRSFWDVDEQYWVRHALKPGITGLAQIRGFRGATHRQEDLENRLRADLEYLHGWHLWRDISILILTAKVVAHKNAY